ncbi:MAG: PIN domain nuclease [Betaproteobacteria bacterium]|nr:PIN domain nuclease [Betaproteobacteria bacterium]
MSAESAANGASRAAAAEVHLDTHILVWLYADPLRAWPAEVRRLLETAALRYSPMARLELQYLREIGRLNVPPAALLAELATPLDLRECRQAFSAVVERAQSLHWTRDVFDRIIVAQASAAGARLVSRDVLIRKHFADAVWDDA